MKTKILLIITATAIFSNNYAQAAQWVKTFDGTSTLGATGTITFDDWGFTGPAGRTAVDFDPVNGFGANPLDPTGGIGQIQHVITTGPDGLAPAGPEYLPGYTPGVPYTEDILGDLSSGGPYPNSNMDSAVSFFQWGYTTAPGSTFNNMQIDYDGDYHIAKDDMTFEVYNYFDYNQVGTTGSLPDGTYPTSLAFRPYTLSDAKGWCGSVLASHPNAHEVMAGQVVFDIAFDVYFQLAPGVYSYMSTEIIPGFEMRSYGDISVNITTSGGGIQVMNARAVVNNTDPVANGASVAVGSPVGDPDLWHNKVSFMGADVIPNGTLESGYTGTCGVLTSRWASGNTGPSEKKYETLIPGIADADSCVAAGGEWEGNAFSGFAFILRADAQRVIDYFDEAVYGPDPMVTDTDGDGVLDYLDNCTVVANASQLDTDGDNYGNACDADFNNDGFVNSLDIGLFKAMFFGGPSEADINGDGNVNSLDNGLFKGMFFQVPGPSGLVPS